MFYWQQVLISLRKLRVSTSFMDFKQTIFLCSQQFRQPSTSNFCSKNNKWFSAKSSERFFATTNEWILQWVTKASDFKMSNEQRVNSNQLRGISQQVANYYIMKWHRGKNNASFPTHFVRNITFSNNCRIL